MHQIDRWQSSRSAVLQIAIGHPLGIGFLGLFTWYALTDPELALSARLASLVMLAIIIALLRVFISEIVMGRALETYLLSHRTLAIVRKGRPTRFVKPGNLVVLCLRSNFFVLRDGTVLSFHVHDTPGSKRQLVEKITTLWYGASEYAAAREAYRVAHFPPRWIDVVAIAIVMISLATLLYAGMLEIGLLIYVSFAAILSLGIIYVLWGSISASRVTWPIGREGRLAGASQVTVPRPAKVLRFPATRPSLAQQIVAYVLLFQIAAIFIPVCRFLLHIPRDSGGYVYVGCFAIFGLVFALLVVRHCHYTLFRGNLFNTVLLSTRTLAILRAGEPVRYVHRKEITAFRPNRQELILSNGTEIGVGFAGELGIARGVMEALWNNWWSFVPEPKRNVPDQGAGIGWRKGAIALGLNASGFGIMIYGDSAEIGWLALPGLALVFFALWYYMHSLAKKGERYQVSLRREEYGEL